ncbi:hypothetical protein [Cryobacterium sp. Y29]|uniref:hypothetical protein n=1 Tax=Cryobacterium sp. Y29 TaxID=2048285 RepID=UPI000CE37DEC|nr:hypothetical protein [Cryobacterium sp. Y29]
MNGSESAHDPVVVYDLMWEGTSRVVGVYASRVTSGGIQDPAVTAISETWEAAEAVDARDLKAQQAATEKFTLIYESLTAE